MGCTENTTVNENRSHRNQGDSRSVQRNRERIHEHSRIPESMINAIMGQIRQEESKTVG